MSRGEPNMAQAFDGSLEQRPRAVATADVDNRARPFRCA